VVTHRYALARRGVNIGTFTHYEDAVAAMCADAHATRAPLTDYALTITRPEVAR
jgi:hypothetical protein